MAALLAASHGDNSRFAQQCVDFIDEKPCTSIRHAVMSRRPTDGTFGPNCLEKGDLAWSNPVPSREIDT
jgi:hypothetical protein